jgi:hypothetical protein
LENETVPFRTHAVKPLECYSRGWLLIKDQYWLFLLINLVGMFIGSAVPLGILMGPMMCGIYFCLFTKADGKAVSFDLLFKGFSYFVESLLATLMMIVPMLILVIPLFIAFIVYLSLAAHAVASRNSPGPLFASMIGGEFLMVAVLILFSSIIGLFFVFAYPLIVDRGLKAWPAVKMSFRGAWHNLGGMIVLILLNLLLGFAGMLFCYVGVFFVGPVLIAALFSAYRQVFGESKGLEAPA